MKQSICYLYEYEEYKQTKNVGFVKSSIYKDKVTFQIHGKSLDCDKYMDLEMFLFTSNLECYSTDRVGYVEGYQGIVNYMITIDAVEVEKFNGYDGILLVSKNKKRYIAIWKKREVRLEHLVVKENQAREEEMCVIQQVVECYDSEEVVQQEAVQQEAVQQEVVQQEVVQQEAVQQEVVQQEAVQQEVVQEEECQETVESEHEIENGKYRYRKIDRQDIAELQQREWKLANNNFLLHGFSNYKHLIFIRMEGRLYLGVPGIYHNKEEAVAKSFGFAYFHKIDGKDLGLQEGEYSTGDTFGYWCRPVTERQGRNVKIHGEINERKGA